MSSQLPNETLSAIFDNLSPSALTTVARASHRFRSVAERILYASIAIQEALPRASPTPTRTHTCASTLLARPHLADAVRKLSIRWHTDPGPREEYLPAALPVLRTLNAALRTLRALEQLELALGLAGAPLDARAVLDGCAFPFLRVFAFSGVGRGALSPKLYTAPSAPVAWFLAGTPALEQLHLLDCYEALELPPRALPRLQLFRGSAPAAASVLPGRPVRLLGLVGHEFVTERDLGRIARASEPVRGLDLSLMSVTPILLRDISRHLGGAVEVLKVKLALRHTLHFALSGIVSTPLRFLSCPLRVSVRPSSPASLAPCAPCPSTPSPRCPPATRRTPHAPAIDTEHPTQSLLAGLSPVLGAFPALRQLDLSPTSVDGVGRGNALEESALCTTWARACPALRHVVFPSKAEWRRDARAPDLWVVAPADGPAAVWTRY
ncbi:hypothetical protein DICSQDRAFT_182034 [Dichomitus squalens LYAD-421 SS1]|uniref:F-box domain-containing protein n=1 Tax=Dichomitus squalens (strain LYAD-421) TaxID=732165 RepID=R7STH5_DICSQ|nr:uncharacterized protein DICSQDRAFT_182034 [Dichomitus squalens LYAD-421 SS1]EJF59371.1 hypothetical protein DICSQDRAFT_182034 [Dichomitus squalens LYAD-421 SS1]